MKLAIVAALASATVAMASPIEVVERQGAGFPTACNSLCNSFFPVYNSCLPYYNAATEPQFFTCLQPICSDTAWAKLAPCLQCWQTNTGQSALPFFGLFMRACGKA